MVNRTSSPAVGAKPTDLEREIFNYLRDIETSAKSDVIHAASDAPPIPFSLDSLRVSEVVLPRSKKMAIIIKVPYATYQSNVRRILTRFITELEKKTKRHVVFIPMRRILPKNFRRRGIKVRPASRRLTSVHDSLLEDIVAPTEIVGKRIRIKSDGSKLIKIHLDHKDKQKDNIEDKLEVFSEAYKLLTRKDAVFLFYNSAA
ncbi:ribosomal protein RPS7 [Cardiosporidium cionae]|uniref:40S ribosomal protein S7 n=1 Tax=Cardiosporidium cionae TaxID=476202 RepID=A0ABQ7JGA2_9APIC|nr:ribosomal protein RPS7 [Cardiosporidium cionae]|eukprot:KAF8822900.1 ribosomal protein RPS7 [Cardiosporidium cionae]